MKHRHAELMMEYAKDAMETNKPWERWEVWTGKTQRRPWTPLSDHPIWLEEAAYRRKPKRIVVSGTVTSDVVQDARCLRNAFAGSVNVNVSAHEVTRILDSFLTLCGDET